MLYHKSENTQYGLNIKIWIILFVRLEFFDKQKLNRYPMWSIKYVVMKKSFPKYIYIIHTIRLIHDRENKSVLNLEASTIKARTHGGLKTNIPAELFAIHKHISSRLDTEILSKELVL